MLHFLRRRLTVAILVALTVLTLSFMLTRLSGDLAISIAGPNASQEDIELIRRAYGRSILIGSGARCRAILAIATSSRRAWRG